MRKKCPCFSTFLLLYDGFCFSLHKLFFFCFFFKDCINSDLKKILHGYGQAPVMKTAFPWGKRHKSLQSFPEPSTDNPFLRCSVHHRGCDCRHGGLEPSKKKQKKQLQTYSSGSGRLLRLIPVVWGAGVHLLTGSPLQDPQTAARWGRRFPDRSWRRSGRYRTWIPLWWSGRPLYCSHTLEGHCWRITHSNPIPPQIYQNNMSYLYCRKNIY